MMCPRCDEKMEPTTTGEFNTRSCIYCSGTWVDYETLQSIVAEHSDTEDQDPYKGLEFDEVVNIGNRVCPSCDDAKLHVFKAGDIELDICKNCRGIFFDDGEIEELVGISPEEVKSHLGLSLALKGAIFLLTMGAVSGG